jgi:hypothetical protein
MNPVLFLRIASVLTVIHSALHTIGGVYGTPPPGIQQTTAALMKANQFPVMGLTRSYWDFHLGFGLAIGLFLLIEGVIFWQLSSLAKTNRAQLRPILVIFLIGYLALAGISWTYFFPPPVITEILIALCLAAAIFAVSPDRADASLRS